MSAHQSVQNVTGTLCLVIAITGNIVPICVFFVHHKSRHISTSTAPSDLKLGQNMFLTFPYAMVVSKLALALIVFSCRVKFLLFYPWPR